MALNIFVGPDLNNQLIAFNEIATRRADAMVAAEILGVRIDTSSGAGTIVCMQTYSKIMFNYSKYECVCVCVEYY